ncbi:DUF6282 family protein [Microbacterium soli]|uniref:DUF6282 family protein n=1 Tax=Microbacterium soli TaxID=446075 RepID=A0ABP7N5K4_9MICO
MFDVHVHSAPDVSPRLADDHQIVEWYDEAGYSGCVLKGHYGETAGRAAIVGRGLNVRVYGSLVLNQQVGGINPEAVAAALEMGARVVWMPTADAHTQQTAGLPRLCCGRPELSQVTYAIPPVDYSTAEACRLILRLVADADAVLATGHLSTAEVAWLLDEARRTGVRRMMLTHPSYTVPFMSASEARSLTGRGAFAEITAAQLLDQPGFGAEEIAAFIRGVGYDRILLSSDAGQSHNPPPPIALETLIEQLVGEGLDRSALVDAASAVPETLVVP